MFLRQISGNEEATVSSSRADSWVISTIRTMSRMIFNEKLESDNCLIEWRQMNHGGDNQDVWAIDDISIREIPSLKTIKRNLNTKYERR